MNKGAARAQASEHFVQRFLVRRAPIEDGKTVICRQTANRRRFLKFCGEVNVVGKFAVNFVRQKTPESMRVQMKTRP